MDWTGQTEATGEADQHGLKPSFIRRLRLPRAPSQLRADEAPCRHADRLPRAHAALARVPARGLDHSGFQCRATASLSTDIPPPRPAARERRAPITRTSHTPPPSTGRLAARATSSPRRTGNVCARRAMLSPMSQSTRSTLRVSTAIAGSSSRAERHDPPRRPPRLRRRRLLGLRALAQGQRLALLDFGLLSRTHGFRLAKSSPHPCEKTRSRRPAGFQRRQFPPQSAAIWRTPRGTSVAPSRAGGGNEAFETRRNEFPRRKPES